MRILPIAPATLALTMVSSLTPLLAQGTSKCDAIITSGLRNYNISSSSSASLNTIYSNYCDASGNTTSSNTSAGLDVVINSIPIGFKLGATDAATAYHNFCKAYQSVYQGSESSSSYESTIVQKAYDSFNQCVAFSALGISIDHRVLSTEATSFYITAAVGKPIQVTGVTLSRNVSCSGQDPSGRLIKYSPTSRVTSNTYLSLVCNRTSTAAANGQFFDEGTISIATNAGNYDVYLPHDAKFAIDYATQIQKQIADLKATTTLAVQDTNKRISGISLRETDQTYLPEYGCGQERVANTSLTYMVGERDGTSCGVMNRNYVKTLSIEIPKN
jgi:hypothetical protein